MAIKKSTTTSAKSNITKIENGTIEVTKTEMIIRVNLTSDLGKSKSGKSTLICSTKGNLGIPAEIKGVSKIVKVGVNVYE